MNSQESQSHAILSGAHETWRWILLFVLYLIGTYVLGLLDRSFYPWGYTALCCVLLFLAWYPIRFWKLVRPHRHVAVPIAVGLVGFLFWILLSKAGIESRLSQYLPGWASPPARASFDPFTEVSSVGERAIFLTARLAGLAILVPIAEELFWRGFLMRWLIREDWTHVSLGAFSPLSFWITVVLFTAAHPEWIAAAVYCILLNAYLCSKKDLWGCVVAHAVTNLALGIYVLVSRDWALW